MDFIKDIMAPMRIMKMEIVLNSTMIQNMLLKSHIQNDFLTIIH